MKKQVLSLEPEELKTIPCPRCGTYMGIARNTRAKRFYMCCNCRKIYYSSKKERKNGN